jgi:hypothetical protein
VYRFALYFFYLLVYLQHNGDALYKNYVDIVDIRVARQQCKGNPLFHFYIADSNT